MADIGRSKSPRSTTTRRHSPPISAYFALRKMLVGLKNVPGMVQDPMDVRFEKIKLQFGLVYLDEIVIFWGKPHDHIMHVRKILRLLNDVYVTLNPKKYKFFTNHKDYLGHVILPGCLKVWTRMFQAVRTLEQPTNLTEPRSWLGISFICRCFAPLLGHVASPLNKKISETAAADLWRPIQRRNKALETLKAKLIEQLYWRSDNRK